MTRCLLAIAVIGTLTFGLVCAADPAEIESLVKQLASDKFKEREAAAKALDAIGAPAVEALRKASLSDDADVRRKAEALLNRIESRLQADSVLAPSRVKLSFKDVKISEAVQDLAKRSGYGMELAPEARAIGDGTMTLETAALPFWEALERFCEAAGLTQQAGPVEVRPRERRRQPFNVNGGPSLEPRIILAPAEENRPPTFLSGALRLRALPAPKTKDGKPRFILEAALEQRVRWDDRPRLTITRAVDLAGQTVEVTVDENRNDNDLESLLRQRIPDVSIGGRSLFQSGPERMACVVDAKADASKSLSELKGTLAAKVIGPPQTVLEVDDVNQAVNQTLKGKSGYEVKLTKLERHDNGEVDLEMEYVGGRPGLGGSFMRVQVFGNGGPGAPLMPKMSPYTLYDADGQPYGERETSESSSFTNGKGSTAVKLVLVPAKR